MCYPNVTRSYLEEQKTGPIAPWLSKEEMAMHNYILAAKDGGYGPTLMWYKCQIANLNRPDEEEIPEEKKQIKQPMLMIAAKYDYIGVPKLQVGGMQPYVKDLKVVEFETGHWVQLEMPMETNKAIKDFLEGK